MKRWLREFTAGVVFGFRAFTAKDLRSRSRGWRPGCLLTVYLGLIALGTAGFLGLMTRLGAAYPVNVGVNLFSALAVGAVLLLAFITPALTAGAISGEKERRTLDLLLVTRASPLGLATGKLASYVFYIFFLLCAALPAFAVVYLFGGVPAEYLAMALAVAAMTALAHASLGLFLSALLRRTVVASVVAYLVVLVLIFGLPFTASITRLVPQEAYSGAGVTGLPPSYLYASPLVALASVLPASPASWGMPLVGDIVRLALAGGSAYYGGGLMLVPTADLARTAYVAGFDPTTGQPTFVTTWAPWVHYFGFSAGLTLFSLLGSAWLMSPLSRGRRWRPSRPKRSEARDGQKPAA